MAYKLIAPQTPEEHAENIIHLFVRDSNGVPQPSARIKIWAGPAPTGQPAYWSDDVPFRNPAASGMLEFITMSGQMPEDRDYWMQIVDTGGKPQSDPIQFHFPRGKSIWITATLQQEGAPAATGSAPIGGAPSVGAPAASTPMPSVAFDARLAAMNVKIQTLNPAPGEAYWKIISVQYQDEKESSGNHHVYYTVLDEKGITVPGVPVQFDWMGREANDVPSQVYTDGNGSANYAMYKGPSGWRPEQGPGPYSAWVGDPDLRGGTRTKISGEKLVGVGLPMNTHVNFIATWKKVIAAAPVATQPAAPAQPATPPPTTPPPAAPTAPASESTYTVVPGDTLYGIARKTGASVQDISKANNIANPSLIKPGQVLKIPKK